MAETPVSNSSKKRYPAVYERSIPVAISILAIIIAGMLVFTVAVALGMFA